MKYLVLLVCVLAVFLVLATPALAFSDIPSSDWQAVGAATVTQTAGWFRGYDDGSFRPNRLITRPQLAAVAIRSGTNPPLGENGPATLEDVERYVPWVATSFVIWGENYITRIQVAILMWRTYMVKAWFGITVPAEF